MTTYKDIRGTHITTVTTDPPAPVNGQMWYNSTEQVIKGFTSNVAGSWATQPSLNTGRFQGGGSGTQTSALAFGGEYSGSPSQSDHTESWNGSSWTEVNDLNKARNKLPGCGASNTSALAFGGDADSDPAVADTESWNGSSWTEVANLNTGRGRTTGTGIATAAIICGGGSGVQVTETWNGSSWTEVADLNQAKSYLPISGTYTSAITGGGLHPPSTVLTTCESWDGSTWTEVADMNTGGGGRVSFGQDNSNAISAEGTLTESWNGSAWSEVVDKNVNVGSSMAGDSPAGAGFVFGGSSPGSPQYSGSAEQFTSPVTSTVTFTAS
jgi:hypothetical protein